MQFRRDRTSIRPARWWMPHRYLPLWMLTRWWDFLDRNPVALWWLQIWHAHHNARVIADFEERMSGVIWEATGGRMSKPYYLESAMRAEITSESERNIEFLAHSDPIVRSTGRLNRDVLNVLCKWIEDEFDRQQAVDAIANERNLDHLGSSNPTVAATARLNRELVKVYDEWMKTEAAATDAVNSFDLMVGAMHAVNTICGSILFDMPKGFVRNRLAKSMRRSLIKRFDAMVKAVDADSGKDDDGTTA